MSTLAAQVRLRAAIVRAPAARHPREAGQGSLASMGARALCRAICAGPVLSRQSSAALHLAGRGVRFRPFAPACVRLVAPRALWRSSPDTRMRPLLYALQQRVPHGERVS